VRNLRAEAQRSGVDPVRLIFAPRVADKAAHMARLALADLSEGLNRGWGHMDSRSIMMLQTERAGVEIKVDPQRLAEAMEKKNKG
jgi:hypothetical protein